MTATSAGYEFDTATELLVVLANEFDQFLIERESFMDALDGCVYLFGSVTVMSIYR